MGELASNMELKSRQGIEIQVGVPAHFKSGYDPCLFHLNQSITVLPIPMLFSSYLLFIGHIIVSIFIYSHLHLPTYQLTNLVAYIFTYLPFCLSVCLFVSIYRRLSGIGDIV